MDIPSEILSMHVDLSAMGTWHAPPPATVAATHAALDEAMALMADAKCPLIVIGADAARALWVLSNETQKRGAGAVS